MQDEAGRGRDEGVRDEPTGVRAVHGGPARRPIADPGRDALLAGDRGFEGVPADADPATAAVTAISAQMGAWGVRVHNVPVSRDAVDVAALWNAGGGRG